MRSVRLGLLALPVVLLAACTSAQGSGPAGSAGPGPSSPGPSATASSGPAAAQNEADAQTEADHLVAVVSLPPGVVRIDTPPAGLSASVMGTPASTQLIDSVSFYRVPMSLLQAQAWFQAHPQDGFTLGGTASTTGPADLHACAFQYVPSATPSPWGTATLDISLASQGSTAAIRVEGVAQWIDPSPVKDASPGPAIRVTIAGGCPPTDRGVSDISNPDAPDLDAQLLPAAAPTAGLTCVYDGGNGTPFGLVDSRQLDATQAAAAAAQVQAVPLGSRGNGPHSCPADDGKATVLVFSYPGRADVDIWERTSGCTSTDNGRIVGGLL